MASTSMTLGPHWEAFIKSEVEAGRYATASEVVRAGLRELEERRTKLEALRDHLATGHAEALSGTYVDASADDIMARAKTRAAGSGR
jgi:antitoxin ParD1/3/4